MKTKVEVNSLNILIPCQPETSFSNSCCIQMNKVTFVLQVEPLIKKLQNRFF